MPRLQSAKENTNALLEGKENKTLVINEQQAGNGPA